MNTKRNLPYPKGYNGALSTRIAPDDLTSEEELGTLHDERVRALFEHYKITLPTILNPSSPQTIIDNGVAWMRLALRLAYDHVPGLQRAPKKGRPRVRKGDDMVLVLAIELLRKSGLNIAKSIEMVAKSGIVSGAQSTLLSRYKNAIGKSYKDSQNKAKGIQQLAQLIAKDKSSSALREAVKKALAAD